VLGIALALGACSTAPMKGPVTKLAGANAVRDSEVLADFRQSLTGSSTVGQ